MAEIVNMPKLGFDMQEGMLVRWVKTVGDPVSEGDVIAEIETDKATVEVEAYAKGTVLKLLVEENTVVGVGEAIAVIGAEGEDVSDISGDAAPAAKAPPEEEPEAEKPTPSVQTESSDDGAGYPGGVKASPVARRMAEERGIDLKRVSGTGPGGRIVKRDVEGFTPGEEAPAAPAMETGMVAMKAPTYKPMESVPYEVIEPSRMRKTIAQRTRASFEFVPHFYVTSEIDMGPALELRKQINAMLEPEDKVTVNDMIVKAVALALREFPNLNTHFHGDRLIRYQQINIGIAVALEGGLMNVVCRDADKRTLSDMAIENKAMINRAREGRVRPEDVDGATFTVSNLGAYDVEHFLAIINPPEAGILAVGSAREVPVVVNGRVTVGVRMKATISIDHQVSDGAEGARYMQLLKELLENPMRLLV